MDDSGNDDGGAPVEAPARYEVVRSGATIAWFFSHAMPGEQPLIPPQVVSAQIRKL